MEKLLGKLDEIARKYNDTKEQYYKDLWYKKVKEYGTRYNSLQRSDVSRVHAGKKRDWLFWLLWHTSRKVHNLSWRYK